MKRRLELVTVAAALALVTGCGPANGRTSPPAPAGPTTQPAPASPPASDDQGAPGGPRPGGTVGSAPWGRLFYYPRSPGTGSAALVAWRPGESRVRPRIRLDSYAALYTSSISADGARIAFSPGRGGDDTRRPLVVAPIDGGARRTLPGRVLADCPPTWSPDGRRLAIVRGVGEPTTGFVNVASGAFTVGIVDWGCHRAWSGDGRSMASVVSPAGDLWIARSDRSGGDRRVPGIGGSDGGARRVTDVMSLSAGARLAAVNVRYDGRADPDPRRQVTANEIVNTTTGAKVRLPVSGVLEQAYFLPTGDAVIRTRNGSHRTVTLLSPTMATVATVTEPATLSGSVLLGYDPP
jgi:hypothetical protein